MCMSFDPLSLLGGAFGIARSVTEFTRAEADREAMQREAENAAAMTEHQAALKDHQTRKNAYEADKAKRDRAREYAARDGASRSLLAARGVELDSGSALDVLVDSARRRAEDLFAVDEEAQYQNSNLRYESSLLRAKAKSQADAGRDRRTTLEKGFDAFDHFSPAIGKVAGLFSL
jgi:hypothetical protein